MPVHALAIPNVFAAQRVRLPAWSSTALLIQDVMQTWIRSCRAQQIIRGDTVLQPVGRMVIMYQMEQFAGARQAHSALPVRRPPVGA